MADMNTYQFTGRLGADPELRTTGQGTPVTSLRVAVGKRKDDETLWLDVTAWQATAENAARFLSRGSRVAISGRVEGVRTFERRNGEAGAALEVTAHDVTFLDTKGESDGGHRASSPAPSGGAPSSGPPEERGSAADDDVPF